MTLEKPKVGDVLWYESSSRLFRDEEVTITKVGRKWAYFGHDRFEIGTCYVDGGYWSSPGRLWATRADAEEYNLTESRWRTLKSSMAYGPPDGVTSADVEAAAKLLKASIACY